MKVSEYISQFRILADDEREPFLWSNNIVALWANEAYVEMAKLTRCIRDRATTTDSCVMCTISITAATAEYTLHKKILDIYSVKHSGRTTPLGKTSEMELDANWTNWWNLTQPIPDYYLLDRNLTKILFVPIPSVDGTVRMSISRLPLVSLLPYNSDRDVEPDDLREEWHPYLMYYILFKAYNKDDIETYDPKKAANNYALFIDKVEQVKRDMARCLRMERAFAPAQGAL